ncbi:uncharacterized protein K452DRAFT_291850 [Aplosporella prunicola CBS 121167]|uniref:NADH:flavin oxidoreductase/NADH oxidase N-terminal domain-containing protein n=1 Tax=Aplosporella prunicola CBS 121167 TaxID=1176127 RepID=A0A6A6AZI4_9PEZI|nr:uncharacterized protein K452DRAFT_291850 [Aplosporella prunicola CBS 121167]KAF2137056.1 hypothetical protein K452DRAFT_291850 [Aplosporella prunicola CBS 121167]
MTATTSTTTNSALFTPLPFGPHTLSHRLVLPPLTRLRASRTHVPLPSVETYYTQRASTPGTLLISEAVFISPRASGYAHAPTLATSEALAAWKTVTDAVHANGSRIYAQLWALGRTANPAVLAQEDGNVGLVSSSAVPLAPGTFIPAFTGPEAGTPRAMSEDEIRGFIADYADAARAAVSEAGFDGVEIHGASGYLVDQFTSTTVNQRTDAWGGSVEKRARFGVEVARAVADAVGPERVGMRLSPWSGFQGMGMPKAETEQHYGCLIRGLRDLGLGYLHLVQGRGMPGGPDESLEFALEAWGLRTGNKAPVILAGGYDREEAMRAVDEEYKGLNVLIAMGRYFISNPDLVFRLKREIALNMYERETFYMPETTKGFIDYEFSEEWKREVAEA